MLTGTIFNKSHMLLMYADDKDIICGRQKWDWYEDKTTLFVPKNRGSTRSGRCVNVDSFNFEEVDDFVVVVVTASGSWGDYSFSDFEFIGIDRAYNPIIIRLVLASRFRSFVDNKVCQGLLVVVVIPLPLGMRVYII